ncbi:MAG: bile acid:sodium symporter [Bacteroidota bacterium]
MLTPFFTDILINATLAIIMLGVGMSLTTKEFKRLLQNPKGLVVALSTQLFLVPALAFLLAYYSGLAPAMQVGMVIVSACASGASSNLVTHLFRGNVALAISMTTLNSLITLISLPAVSNLALWFFMKTDAGIKLPFLHTMIQIFLVTLLPATVGMFIRYIRPAFAIGLDKPLRYLLPVLLAIVFTIKIFGGTKSGGTGITSFDIYNVIPWMLALNIGAMLIGFITGKLLQLEFRDRYTISIEVGLHNTALALVIAGTILHNSEMEKPAVVYAMFSFFTAIGFVFVIKKWFNLKNALK